MTGKTSWNRAHLAVRQRRKFRRDARHHAANGQSQSHSICFVVMNGLNTLSNPIGLIPCPNLPRDDNCIGILTLRYHPEHPTSIHRVIHRFDRVVDQVKMTCRN